MFKTVRSRFSLIYIGLVALIVLLGLFSVWRLTLIESSIQGLIKTNYDSISRLSNMEEALWHQDRAVIEYLYGDDRQEAERQFCINYYEFRDNCMAEKATLVIPAEIGYMEDIQSSYDTYVEAFESLKEYDLADASQRELAIRFYSGDIRNDQELVQTAMDKLHASNEEALFARRDEARRSVALSIQITAIAFLIAAAGGLLFATIYTRRFFAPLYEITENIRHVREGNLDRQIPVQSRDEFGMLAGEFNRMVGRLAEFERTTLGSVMNERSRADSLVKSVHQPVIILDEEGRLLLMNSAFEGLFHLTEENSLGKLLHELLPQREFSEYAAALKAGTLTNPQDRTLTLHTGGEDRFFQLAVTPIPGPEGKTTGLIILMHDITEMKQLEKMRGDYIATISHEFKTPLTSIVMGADLLGNSGIGTLNKDQAEIVDTLKEDSQRLEMLVSEILELSRMESAKTLYSFTPCEPCRLIEASHAQFKAMAERGGVRLTVHCPEGLPRVRADFSKITWVLNNLLSNAIKYTSEGDDIHVEAAAAGDHVAFSVTDTGVGVPAEFVDQIFEKYVQIKGYDIEVRGSGLGLAAAREIIDAHGGRIWCDTGVGRGSRFVFTLDLFKEASE